ncbi:MAG: T9SS type A sorting domain-containing protein [Bacteroidia bacterium]|nr:T9SS type A sorting domain-containing protein [Bacteroidia bacterium]
MKTFTFTLLSFFLFSLHPPTLYAQCSIEVGAAGNTEICEGDSVLLEATNGFLSYEWNTEDTSRLIWASDPGWYIIEATDDTGCVAVDSIQIIVNEPPILEIGADPADREICIGDSILLEASNGFLSYAWNTSDTARVIYVSPEETVEIVLEALDENACEARARIEIIVENCNGADDCELEIETDDDDPLICQGDSLVLEPNAGFNSYSWNTGDSTRIIWASDSGLYVVTAMGDSGCVAMDSIFLEVVEPIALTINSDPDPAEICVGGEITLEIPDGFDEIFWSTEDDDESISLTLEESRLIVVEAIDENGCDARAEIEIMVDTSCTATSIDRDFQENLPYIIGPNPVKDILGITYTGITGVQTEFSLLNLKGQLVQSWEKQSLYPQTRIQLDLHKHSPSIYFLEIKEGDKLARLKLLIH